jgi:2-amino-4-hydroxy-6-hydroxymethyldihydropteridine diphosphokinase
MYCHVTIGSNIEPQSNIANAIEQLSGHFGTLTVFPRVFTEAQDIDSNEPFINTAAIFCSRDNVHDIKAILNRIEESLGRDRDDPNRSHLSRTCDIDIVALLESPQKNIFISAKEPYVRAVFESQDHAPINSSRFPQLRDGSSTVDLDCRSC